MRNIRIASPVEKRMRPMVYATRLVPCDDDGIEESKLHGGWLIQYKWFAEDRAAWKWIARGFIFRMYFRFCGNRIVKPGDCLDCKDIGCSCEWHDVDIFKKRVARIAKLLRRWSKLT